MQKLTENGSETNFRSKTVTLSQENSQGKLYHIGLCQDFIDITPKHKQKNLKINK